MQRFVAIEVAPNTSELLGVIETIALQKGVISYINVTFPGGCVGLVYLQIFCHGEQISPWNKVSALRGNDITIVALKDYELLQPPYEVLVKVWNLDDTYTHTPLVDIMELENVEKSLPELLLGL